MPTTNNDDILEIDLPDTQEDHPVPESSVNGTKKKPRLIELDRVSALMTVFVAFGVVLIAICNSAMNLVFFTQLDESVFELCGFTMVGLTIALTTIVAEFFVRSNARLVYRSLITVVFMFAVFYCSTNIYPTKDPRDMTIFQLIIWSASAVFQLVIQWSVIVAHRKLPDLSIDSKVFLSSWGERPSHLARILLLLALIAIFFASLTQAEYWLRFIGPDDIIFVGLMLLVANLIWAALIVFPQVRLAAGFLVIAGIVAFISLILLLNDFGAWQTLYLSYCVAACVGWLACGGLIKTVAAESNPTESKPAAQYSNTVQPSNEASPG